MSTPQPAAERFRRWATDLITHHLTHGVPDGSAVGEVYQSSTIGALLDGVYDGNVSIAELLRHGDFGLGTFNHLDGEMVILDGICYHLRADGTATQAAPTDLTPFAAVTRFRTDSEIPIRSSTDQADVTSGIDAKIATENLIYAIRITGHFSHAPHAHRYGTDTPLPSADKSHRRASRNRLSLMWTAHWRASACQTSNKASPLPDITCTSSTATAPAAATSLTSA